MTSKLEREITKVHRECWAKGSAQMWRKNPATSEWEPVPRIYPDYWPSYQAIRRIEARLANGLTDINTRA